MKHSLNVGFSFGLTSGIITTLGLVIGLHSSTRQKLVVIGGILVIAIADALSDAMGIHISEEAESQHSQREIWESTISTLVSKFFFSFLFVIPFLVFELSVAILVCIAWGLVLLTLFSIYLARRQNIKPYKVIFEHLIIAILVIILSHLVGDFLGRLGGFK